MAAPEGSTPDSAAHSPAAPPSTSSRLAKPPRVLACVLCHQRKVKCDRRFPCANCIRVHAQCVPATVARRRPRRRFPEGELLDRIRKYEELLQANNIKFQPLSKVPGTEKSSPNAEDGYVPDQEQQDDTASLDTPPSSHGGMGMRYIARNFWHAMNLGLKDDPDDTTDYSSDEEHEHERVIKNAWKQVAGDNIFLMLGTRTVAVPVTDFHPDAGQIFRLWQIYVDNVNPLMKVVHTPSLQARIIDTLDNMSNISPALEALIFSIYCMAIVSLSADDCETLFGSSREALLSKYHYAAQQALLNCEFLRTTDHDCVTALYLYTTSIAPSTDPTSLSSTLGIVCRIALRLGYQSESFSTKFTPFEVEMRRRLWWSLVLFDNRIGEIADHKDPILSPTWDCKPPANVNDSELRPEMKEAPPTQLQSTDSIYAAVRGEIGNFVRHSNFHLDFTNPSLKSVVKDVQQSATPMESNLIALERTIEDKYLKYCDPEIPIHYFTLWSARSYIARYHLMEWMSRFGNYSSTMARQTEQQTETAISHSMTMLECDTKINSSPIVKGFSWMGVFYFPLPAYIHLIQYLKRRPFSRHADRVWGIISDNAETRLSVLQGAQSAIFKVLANIIFSAWDVRVAAHRKSGLPLAFPKVVTMLKQKLAEMEPQQNSTAPGQQQLPGDFMNMDTIDLSMPMPMGMNFGNASFLGSMGMGGTGGYTGTVSTLYPGVSGPGSLDADINQLDWSSMGWGLGQPPIQ